MTVQQFLRYRFAAMLAWFVLMMAALAVANVATAYVNNPAGRVATGASIITAALLLGLRGQRALLRRIDPDGSLRDTVRRGM